MNKEETSLPQFELRSTSPKECKEYYKTGESRLIENKHFWILVTIFYPSPTRLPYKLL